MNKKVVIPIIALLCVSLILAVGFYKQITDILNISNPITVTGDGESTPCNAGETCLGAEITVSNAGNNDREVIISTTANSDVTTSYVGFVTLKTKDTTTWQPNGALSIDMKFTLVGDKFDVSTEVPEGYELVYALDHDNRFTNYASVVKVNDINGNLPYSTDWNANPSPDYCDMHNTYDDYEHCNGAKIWIVKSSDIGTCDSEGVCPLSWANMNDYLYETDLIRYFDNSEGKIIIPAGSFIKFYPEYSVDKYASESDVSMVTTVA